MAAGGEGQPTTTIIVDNRSAGRIALGAMLELTKPRLSMMTVITAVVGYMLADPDRSGMALFGLIFGTSLSAGGAAALNQWWERESDAKMVRTRMRPIPSGILSAEVALIFGLFLSTVGVFLLWWANNGLAAVLSAMTIALYVLVYTPMKRFSSWNTAVGAIPGAIPPLIGWAAAEGSIGGLGWVLFAILLFWQIPHFMAIAWMHRLDYAQAGYRMLTTEETSGRSAAFQSLVCTVVLVFFTLVPVWMGKASWVYGFIALVGGLAFLRAALRFSFQSPRDSAARPLFLLSISHLPLVLSALVLDVWLFTY